MAKLLVSLGLSRPDALDIVNMVQLPSDMELLTVLQHAASAYPTPASGARDGVSLDGVRSHPIPLSNTTSLAASTVGSVAGSEHGEDSDEDVPLYSRVTDDIIVSGTLPPLPPLSNLGGLIFGGGGSVGGRGGGEGGGRFPGGGFTGGDGGDDGRLSRAWSWLCQRLLEMLPAALAVSLALPPAALHRLISTLVWLLLPAQRHLLPRAATAAVFRLPRQARGLPTLMLTPRTLQMASPMLRTPRAGGLTGDAGHAPRPSAAVEPPVMEWDAKAVSQYLAAWPAAWVPNDAAALPYPPTAAAAAAGPNLGSSDPLSWVRSAAGPPLSGSALAAMQWLSRVADSPRSLAQVNQSDPVDESSSSTCYAIRVSVLLACHYFLRLSSCSYDLLFYIFDTLILLILYLILSEWQPSPPRPTMQGKGRSPPLSAPSPRLLSVRPSPPPTPMSVRPPSTVNGSKG